jgi:cyanate permease
LRKAYDEVAGRSVEHRRWMIRSYALTFGAVTLRLYLAVAIATQMDFAVAYRAISFLAWVPNLALVEWWLRRGRPRADRQALEGATPV